MENTSAKRLRGPARIAGISEARPENAVNGVFRADALYLPGRQKLLGCFLRAVPPVVAGGATTTTVALTAAIIWVLGNNFPPRARRHRKQFTISGWLSVTLWSGRQDCLRCGLFGSGRRVRPLQDSRHRPRLVSDFSLSSRPGVFGQPATCRVLVGPRSERTGVEPLKTHLFLWCLSLLETGKALEFGLLSSLA